MACEAMGSAPAPKPFDIASIAINSDGVERKGHTTLLVGDLMVELSINSVIDEAS